MSVVVEASPVKTFIHPSACVEPGAQLGSGVRIGPFCHVGPEARLGDGVRLISHVVVAGVTEIGAQAQRGRIVPAHESVAGLGPAGKRRNSPVI